MNYLLIFASISNSILKDVLDLLLVRARDIFVRESLLSDVDFTSFVANSSILLVERTPILSSRWNMMFLPSKSLSLIFNKSLICLY